MGSARHRKFLSGRLLLPAAICAMIAFAVAYVHGNINVTAGIVLGQSGFTTSTCAVTQAGLCGPLSVAIDKSVSPNRLYVVDNGNNRILGWHDVTALANGAPADLVIGQVDFRPLTF